MPRLRRLLLTWLAFAGLVGALLVPVSVSADPLTAWTAGPGAALDPTYDGYIDVPRNGATVPNGNFTVAGWFVDKTAQGWAGADDVQVWLGTMGGSGGKLLAKAVFAQSRPDVAAALGNPYFAASGFGATIPAGSLAAGSQTLSVYAHTGGKGWWYKQITVNVSGSAPAAASAAPAAAPAPAAAAPAPAAAAKPTTGGALPIVGFEKPKDGEQVPTCCDYQIIGYALDRNAQAGQGVAGSGIDTVAVYMGDRDNGGVFLGNADLGFSDSTPVAQYGGQFANSGWRITFKPTQFHVNTYLHYAYAHSVVTGKSDNAIRYFAIKD